MGRGQREGAVEWSKRSRRGWGHPRWVCELNVLPKPSAQCDGSWRWDGGTAWGIFRSWEWGCQEWYFIVRYSERWPCLPALEDMARRQPSTNQDTDSAGTFTVGLPVSKTVRNKSLLFLSPGVWCSGLAAWGIIKSEAPETKGRKMGKKLQSSEWEPETDRAIIPGSQGPVLRDLLGRPQKANAWGGTETGGQKAAGKADSFKEGAGGAPASQGQWGLLKEPTPGRPTYTWSFRWMTYRVTFSLLKYNELAEYLW